MGNSALRHCAVDTMRLFFLYRIILGSERRSETKQGIEGKIVRFRSVRNRNRVRIGVRVRDKDRRSEPDRRSKAINFGAC